MAENFTKLTIAITASRWYMSDMVVASHAADCRAESKTSISWLKASFTFGWLWCRAKANNEMQVSEVKQMLQLCSDFSSMAEGFGCRPVATLRTAVQLQCKSYLDALHHHTLTNLTGHILTCPTTPITLLPCCLPSYLQFHPLTYSVTCIASLWTCSALCSFSCSVTLFA